MTKSTSRENLHLHSMNKIFSNILLAHLPVSMIIASFFQTSLLLALLGSMAICSLPLYLTYFSDSHRLTSIVHGVALMFYSSLLIHLSKGMIELHFHIFVSLAVMIVFANPWVIFAAAATIAVHHVGFFLLLPESVFNYKASFGIVLVHAAFVVLQTGPCMWIAQKFRGYIIEQGTAVVEMEKIFNTMKDSIDTLMSNNNILTESSELQTTSVTQTAETINQMSSMAMQTSENAAQSKMISEKTKGAAWDGLKIVEQVDLAIKKIKTTNETVISQISENKSQLNDIVETIRQIEEKTNIINDIVFQTKLLSFNASVEAARAGEHGKGFAVVAEEIGNLAATSGNASKEINHLINTSVQKVQTIASETESKVNYLVRETQASIYDGEKKVKNCEDTFNELTSYINDLNTRVNGISAANEEQSMGVAEMNTVIKQLEKSNLQNHQSLKISVEVSEQLATLSEGLGSLVSKLNNKHAA